MSKNNKKRSIHDINAEDKILDHPTSAKKRKDNNGNSITTKVASNTIEIQEEKS